MLSDLLVVIRIVNGKKGVNDVGFSFFLLVFLGFFIFYLFCNYCIYRKC